MTEVMAPITVPARKSKQEFLGKGILERIYMRKLSRGGSFTIVTGAPGSAKTSVMLSISKYIFKNHPTEKVFWSSSYGTPLQFFPLQNFEVFVKKGTELQFFDRFTQQKYDISFKTFETFEELYQMCKPGVLNCPFFGNRDTWIYFTRFLMTRAGWHTVLYDELAEICPANTGGDQLKRIEFFAHSVVGQSRKCFLTLVGNTQAITELDYRVRNKLNIRIFLPGSVADRKQRVTQKAIDNLNEDHVQGSQAYIVQSGRFGVIKFTDIFEPLQDKSIEARIEKEVDVYERDRKETREDANSFDTGRRGPESDRINQHDKYQDYRNAILS